MTPDDFIAQIAPAARASAVHTNIPASFTIAEAALESAWGASQLAQEGFNLFGVKADPAWHGDVVLMRTREFIGGQWMLIMAKWRKYAGWLYSIDDHARFLLDNRRYQPAFQHKDGEDFARAVAAAGYATDPQYADKIISIIRKHDLTRFDTEAETA